ncbi:MAG: hypothetical protein PHF64_02615 [Methanoregula sp.]|nr:hypothetical protein [Methanoregula sp.]
MTANMDTVPDQDQAPAPDASRRLPVPAAQHPHWKIRASAAPLFVKVGRVYRDGEDLVIRSDLDTRGLVVPAEALQQALHGDTGTLLYLDLFATAGTVRLSTSGRALNMCTREHLYTVPMRSLTPLLAHQHRKAPLFVPAGEVAPEGEKREEPVVEGRGDTR